MANGSFRIVGPPLRKWINDLEKLENEPSPETQAKLSSVMDQALGQARLNTHVLETGRLLASVHGFNEARRLPRSNVWRGTISVGKGVPYSHFEHRRDDTRPDWTSHPSHDPYDGMEIYYAEIEAVLRTLGD